MIDPVIVQIPPDVDNLQLPDPNLPDPNLLSFYKEKEERCFWIDEEISSQSLEICRLKSNGIEKMKIYAYPQRSVSP